MADLFAFEKKINYTFRDKSLLVEALTHSSYVHENGRKKRKCNERMEFLGDAVLSIISAEYLYEKYPNENEGTLTKRRSALVCTESLSEFARLIDLSDYLILGKGAALSGDEKRKTVLENAFEAVIAAIYLDGGMDAAMAFVLPFLKMELKMPQSQFKDYKSQFQIIIQQNPDEIFQYKLVDEYGPDHDKRYVVELYVNSNVVGKGEGTSKKNAEQEAARQALELMGVAL
ncbi:MAG: ribonuclease III [Eubacterium sp.]|nr:ribonuclease III [Eubacterium sp.]